MSSNESPAPFMLHLALQGLTLGGLLLLSSYGILDIPTPLVIALWALGSIVLFFFRHRSEQRSARALEMLAGLAVALGYGSSCYFESGTLDPDTTLAWISILWIIGIGGFWLSIFLDAPDERSA